MLDLDGERRACQIVPVSLSNNLHFLIVVVLSEAIANRNG